MDSSAEFKHIVVSGSPYERGLQHGKQLSVEIREVYEYYESNRSFLDIIQTLPQPQYSSPINNGRTNHEYHPRQEIIADVSR